MSNESEQNNTPKANKATLHRLAQALPEADRQRFSKQIEEASEQSALDSLHSQLKTAANIAGKSQHK